VIREVVVPGEPVPQPRHRVAVRGRFAQAYIPSEHGIHAFKASIIAAVQAAGWQPVSGPVEVEIECVFSRPKSHKRRRGGVVRSAPKIPLPDWDNLGKGVCDALNGIAYEDDKQIACGSTRKRYAEEGEPAGTRIVVRSR
jgi:Holliday junction resolvase RusA-like endonuclease